MWKAAGAEGWGGADKKVLTFPKQYIWIREDPPTFMQLFLKSQWIELKGNSVGFCLL